MFRRDTVDLFGIVTAAAILGSLIALYALTASGVI